MPSVKFKYKDEACVYPKLINAVNVLCIAKGKDCFCTSGYRSIDKQKTIAKEVLASNPGSWQREDGFVYSKKGECLAAAYGKSNHCYCIAMDISDSWFKELMNEELIKDGLIKPISYEPACSASRAQRIKPFSKGSNKGQCFKRREKRHDYKRVSSSDRTYCRWDCRPQNKRKSTGNGSNMSEDTWQLL